MYVFRTKTNRQFPGTRFRIRWINFRVHRNYEWWWAVLGRNRQSTNPSKCQRRDVSVQHIIINQRIDPETGKDLNQYILVLLQPSDIALNVCAIQRGTIL